MVNVAPSELGVLVGVLDPGGTGSTDVGPGDAGRGEVGPTGVGVATVATREWA
jgi:hypothetical protein